MPMHSFEPELDGSHRRTEGMLRLMVYSHDSFGLGNIRRMLAICEHLHASIGGVSILVISGYALYYTTDRLHDTSATAHEVLGTLAIVFALVHWRARERSAANRRGLRSV